MSESEELEIMKGPVPKPKKTKSALQLEKLKNARVWSLLTRQQNSKERKIKKEQDNETKVLEKAIKQKESIKKINKLKKKVIEPIIDSSDDSSEDEKPIKKKKKKIIYKYESDSDSEDQIVIKRRRGKRGGGSAPASVSQPIPIRQPTPEPIPIRDTYQEYLRAEKQKLVRGIIPWYQ